MKHLFLLLLAIATTVLAEPVQRNKTIICDSKDSIFTQLSQEYEERPIWMGHSPLQTTDLVLTANTATGAWTLVEYGDTWACVLAVGERHRVVADKTI
jgi:hypothetical protein